MGDVEDRVPHVRNKYQPGPLPCANLFVNGCPEPAAHVVQSDGPLSGQDVYVLCGGCARECVEVFDRLGDRYWAALTATFDPADGLWHYVWYANHAADDDGYSFTPDSCATTWSRFRDEFPGRGTHLGRVAPRSTS